MNLYKKLASFCIIIFIWNHGYTLEKIEFMTEEYPPYNFKDKSDKVVGIAVDLLTAIHKEMGSKRTNTVELYPWARGYFKVQIPEEKNALFSTTRTLERESMFKWVGPIIDTTISIIGLKKNSKIKISNDADLKKYKYSTIRSDIGGLLLGAKGVETSSILNSARFNVLIKQVNQGRTDFIAYEQNVAKWLIKKYGYNSDDYQVFYILQKGQLYYAFNLSVDDETVKAYQTALDKVRKNKPFMKQIKQKYLGSQ